MIIFTRMDFVPVVISNIQLGIIIIQFVQEMREWVFLAEGVRALKRFGNH